MFLVTKDEVDAACTEKREDPMVTAPPYTDDVQFEVRGGAAIQDGVVPAKAIDVAEGLKDVFDPEIPVNIYDLGLVYDIYVSSSGDVSILLTLTSPNCPVAGELPEWVAEAASAVAGTGRVGVKLTFDPPWVPAYMSEIAKVATGIW